MTERAEAYLKKYPEPEYVWVEDDNGDPVREKLFNELTDEEIKYVWRKQGYTEKEIALVFDI